MPKDYEAIKQSLRKQHKDWDDSRLKQAAAKITNAKRKSAGKPPAKFHVKHREKADKDDE